VTFSVELAAVIVAEVVAEFVAVVAGKVE